MKFGKISEQFASTTAPRQRLDGESMHPSALYVCVDTSVVACISGRLATHKDSIPAEEENPMQSVRKMVPCERLV